MSACRLERWRYSGTPLSYAQTFVAPSIMAPASRRTLGQHAIMPQGSLVPKASSFVDFINFNATFVDKTLAIQAFLRDGPSDHLILRPRRCGKSFTLSMIREFLQRPELERLSFSSGDIGDSVFAGTFISEEKHQNLVREHFHQYPVLHLDFKDINGSTYEQMLTSFHEMVLYLIDDPLSHIFVKGVLDRRFMEWREKIERGGEPRLEKALQTLSEALYDAYKQRVVVLCDEYDSPMHNAIEGGYADLASSFFASAFGSLLKGNTAVYASMLVGICKTAKSGWLSGLNNIKTFPMHAEDDRYAKFFLFTEEEVELLRYTHCKELEMDRLREYYGSYKARAAPENVKLFNPLSVVSALRENKIRDYWVDTGSDRFRGDVARLILGQTVKLSIDECTNSKPLQEASGDGLWGLLFYTGYITVDRFGYSLSYPFFRIPNQEVSSQWSAWLREFLKPHFESSAVLQAIRQTIFDGDGHAFRTQFRFFLQEHLSLFRLPSHREKVYQALGFMLIFNLSKSHYTIKMEQDNGYGRSNITAHPQTPDSVLSFIFEMKAVAPHHKLKGKRQLKSLEHIRKELHQATISALEQIEKRQHRARAPPHVTKVHEFGVAFSGTFCVAAVRTLTRTDSRADWAVIKIDTVDVDGNIPEADLIVDDDMDGGDADMALEGRKARSQEKSRLDAPEVTPVASKSATVTIPEKRPETFHGIVIPKEPPPPQDDECCMSNCAICVYDLYEESLDEYRQSVADVRSSLSAMKIPKTDWPSTIRAKNIQGIASRKEMVLSAFEEMERALAKKRESEDDSSSAGRSGSLYRAEKSVPLLVPVDCCPHMCNRFATTEFAFTVLRYTVAEVFLALRIYFLTRKNVYLATIFTLHILAQLGLAIYAISQKGVAVVIPANIPSLLDPNALQICLLIPSPALLSTVYLSLGLSFETFVLIATLIVTAMLGIRNLTRLERALEGSKARSQEKGRLDAPAVTPVASKSATATIPEKRPETFHGMVIPKEPPPPQDDECCMSNCAIGVYDLYEESLDEYRQSVADVRSSLSAMKIPKTDWPSTIRAKNIQGIASRKEMVLSAFEEMERALAKKRESEDDSSSAGLSRLAAAASEGTFRRPRRPQARAVSWLESSARHLDRAEIPDRLESKPASTPTYVTSKRGRPSNTHGILTTAFDKQVFSLWGGQNILLVLDHEFPVSSKRGRPNITHTEYPPRLSVLDSPEFAFTVLIYTVAEVFLALRIYVLTRKNVYLAAICTLHILAQLGLAIYVMSHKAGAVEPANIPSLLDPNALQICLLSPSPKLFELITVYLSLGLSFHTLVLVATLIVTISATRQHPMNRWPRMGRYTKFAYTVLIFTVAEVFLALRVYVLTRKNVYLAAILTLHILVQLGLAIYILSNKGSAVDVDSGEVSNLLLDPNALQVCLLSSPQPAFKLDTVYLSLALSFDTFVLIATLIVTITATRQHPTNRWLRVIQRDGIFYFIVIFSSTLTWLLSGVIARPGVKFINAIPDLNFTAVMINRLHLSLKKVGSEEEPVQVFKNEAPRTDTIELEVMVSRQIMSTVR
ncbi:hypothetical protein D9615_004908 [Tricholomella constricta]|uniref:Uncharacterized protein n=1 Tax=Tricholomella constricta TaxID=117010 RepID=A0A8H5M6H1_9AGAR|nr:hypothetical protein D9615_004908 [Tricholomella constricta]